MNLRGIKKGHFGSLTVGQVAARYGVLLIKDRIQRYFELEARERAELRAFKRKHGYCGGEVNCMVQTGREVHVCEECKKKARFPKRRNGVSEYGRIRRAERERERAEKEAKATKKARRAA